MSIEGQGHFFTIYFPDFVCFVLYKAKISGERLQDHWSSGFRLRRDPVFLFANNKKRIVETFLSWIFFSGKLGSGFLAHLSRRLIGELMVYQSSCRLSVCVSVNIFKLEYLRNKVANPNKILSEPSLGWGKGCIRFWARSDWNSCVHGNG